MINKELMDGVFEQAVKFKATDIYFLPGEFNYQVKLSVNNKFRYIKTFDFSKGQELINHLKFNANMNISEKRRPQLGSFIYNYENQDYFCRLSSLGDFRDKESLVIRIIYDNLTITEQNFLINTQKNLFQTLKSKRGLVLFSGPMGSGKTTTMYKLARSIKEKQVMTIEDPVEIYEPDFLQIQVNNQAGMDYESLLKTALRHHPDVFIIGEIRDSTTAKIAVRAALSGHLVLSTVHARNVYGVISRMSNFGIDTLDLRQTLSAIFYQRLIPTIDGNSKLLFDYLLPKDIDFTITNNGMTKKWGELLEQSQAIGYITEETYNDFIEG